MSSTLEEYLGGSLHAGRQPVLHGALGQPGVHRETLPQKQNDSIMGTHIRSIVSYKYNYYLYFRTSFAMLRIKPGPHISQANALTENSLRVFAPVLCYICS